MKFTDYRLVERELRILANERGLNGHPYARRVPNALSWHQEQLCLDISLSLSEDLRCLHPQPIRRMVRSIVHTSFREN